MDISHTKILIVDDDNDVLVAMKLLLKKEVREIVTEKNPQNILNLITKHHFDFLLLDMNFTLTLNNGAEGIYWLKRVKEINSKINLILMTAYADVDLAVKSLKEGADDFIVKPWNNASLINSLQEVLKKKSNKENFTKEKKQHTVKNKNSEIELIATSEIMSDIFRKVEKIAPTDANVLILGENGTGKDLIARSLHQKSLRGNNNFIKVDIGSLTETLFESELFGHKKGAFTGADVEREGRFEAANNGTLFLDEIGNIGLAQQAKLLSALQNRQIIKLGTNTPINVDIRLICATNVPLSELAKETRFRKDLIYRINTIEIIIPPLRERKEDIEVLTKHYLKFYSDKYSKPTIEISKKVIDKLKNYHFPGNIRELQYAIERAVIMCDSDILNESDILFSPIENTANNETFITETNLNTLEKQTIVKVIEKNNGNISKAAKELGITRTALYRRLGKHEI